MEQNTQPDSPATTLPLTALHARVLQPFIFQSDSLGPAVEALVGLRHREREVWTAPREPHELYQQELLATVTDFLFAGTGGDCCYLRINDATANSWFRASTEMRYGHEPPLPVLLIPGLWIELFLSSSGVGVLSIGLQPNPRNSPHPELTHARAKQFVYRLAQQRPNTTPTLVTPHPRDDPQHPAHQQRGLPPPPATDAPFAERLGALGGQFTLSELVDFLLSPLRERFHHTAVHQQFSVYTVARFGKDAELARETVQAHLGPLLSGLAQIEEPTHAGALEGAVDVPNLILNARHWAAVGSLGAAHLVADQNPPHAFDEQRVPIVRDKYFIAYLVALLQRLTLDRTSTAAAKAVRSFERASSDFDTTLQTLRENMLNFAVSGYFPVISSREAINRFYTLAQRGLRIPETFADIRQALTDLDAARQARHQTQLAHDLNTNIHTVASVQIKVEWLEVFFVSFYATELSHTMGELFHFDHAYTALSTLAWTIVAGAIALFSLKPWQHGHSSRGGFRGMIFLIIVVSLLVIGWFVAGLHFSPAHEPLDGI